MSRRARPLCPSRPCQSIAETLLDRSPRRGMISSPVRSRSGDHDTTEFVPVRTTTEQLRSLFRRNPSESVPHHHTTFTRTMPNHPRRPIPFPGSYRNPKPELRNPLPSLVVALPRQVRPRVSPRPSFSPYTSTRPSRPRPTNCKPDFSRLLFAPCFSRGGKTYPKHASALQRGFPDRLQQVHRDHCHGQETMTQRSSCRSVPVHSVHPVH